MILLFRL